MRKGKIDKVQFINELSRERIGKIPPRKVFIPKEDKDDGGLEDYWADKLYWESGRYDDDTENSEH